MRENDDDAPPPGSEGGALADGLGETAEPGEYSSNSEPYGDGGIDDGYDGDTYDTDDSYDADDSYGGDTYDTYDTDDTTSDDGSFGDGETGDEVVVIDDDTVTDDADVGDEVDTDGSSLDDSDLLAQDASPLEGIGFILDEVRDALFGDEDDASSSVFDPDPADLASDTDLDLTGDGVVDRGDLHEAESPFDFDVNAPHHGHHGGGVIDG